METFSKGSQTLLLPSCPLPPTSLDFGPPRFPLSTGGLLRDGHAAQQTAHAVDLQVEHLVHGVEARTLEGPEGPLKGTQSQNLSVLTFLEKLEPFSLSLLPRIVAKGYLVERVFGISGLYKSIQYAS